MSNLININLYGDGSRNAKLRAEAVYCDRYEECSLYKRGLCCKITSFLSPTCPIGSIHSYGYYTKHAKAYDTLYKETKNNPCYNKLSYPTNMILETVGNDVLINLKNIYLKHDENSNQIVINETVLGSKIVKIPKELLTNDVIKRICDYKPRSLFDNKPITSYSSNVLPDFILCLKTKLPDIYNRFIEEFPDYDFSPNYIGKRAKLKTVNTALKYHLKNYGDFHFERPDYYKLYVVFDNYNSAFLPFGSKNTKLQFEVTDDMTIEITDNNQVLEDTVIL